MIKLLRMEELFKNYGVLGYDQYIVSRIDRNLICLGHIYPELNLFFWYYRDNACYCAFDT